MASQRKREGVDDLVLLDNLTHNSILSCLKKRYMTDTIYTAIGPVLIAINPYVLIPHLYTDATIREYRGKSYFELAPHAYTTADDTYHRMTSFQENQCIIITGESGSGKTETSKIIMNFISAVSGKSRSIQHVKERLLAANPLLEATGNAKTCNNNNSSRFGKYMEVLFDIGGNPVGGRVTNYLLEKSRIIKPGLEERNFHIFYMVLGNASQQEREDFYLESPDYYQYLYASQCYTADGINDAENFREMLEGMDVIGISQEERYEMTRIIAAVLWLGNLSFVEDDSETASVVDR
eukprot:562502_1